MSIEYLGLSEINDPLVVLEGLRGAAYDEIVEFRMEDGTKRIGRIIECYEDRAVIQVFEGTDGMSLRNTRTVLTGHPMEIALSEDILGRTFDGIGRPIDNLGPIAAEMRVDVNGMPLNPCRREYPRNYINTGISAIDTLTTLIRGQKLPIFSGNGLPHNELAAQLVLQSNLGGDSNEKFGVVFAAMGVKYDVAEYFRRTFEESGVSDHVTMFLNLANDPVVERIITPRVALTPNPALKDARVRKAIAYAIQKEALAMVAYDGHALPADSLAPRTSKYYEPMGDYYDLEAAKALLAEAGYADGFTLVVNALQSESKLCEVLQNQLAQIGITLELNLGDIPSWQQNAMSGSYDIYLMSRFGSQVFMTASALDGRRGPLQENYSFVDDPSIYEAIDTVYGTTDIEKGKAAYTELMQWNLENFAVIPLVETATLFGAIDTIQNASLDYNGMQCMYGWLYEE